MDGKIVIGTSLDTKELEKQLREQEKQLRSYEKEAEKLTTTKAKAELDLSKYYEQKELIQDFTDNALKYAQTQEEVQHKLGLEKTQLQELDEAYKTQLDKVKEIDQAIENNVRNQELMRQKVSETNNELNKQKGMESIKQSLGDIGKGISKNIKKVFKWSLALIGVRSVYLGLRQAMGIITSYDDQLKTDIDYMKYALANSLKPVIEWIINAFYKVLALFGYIIKLITGKNIFEKSGVKQFNKDMAGASKSAKELKKTLAGFDEANVLQDNQESGGGGGVGTPSKDLAKMVDEMSQEDIDKIWEEVSKGINNARAGLLDYQDELHEILSNRQAFTDAYGVWDLFVHGIGMMWAGLVDIVGGVWDTIQGLIGMFIDIISGDFDKLGDDFKLFISGILEIVGGLGEFIIGVAETVWGFVKGVLGTVFGWIYDNVIKPVWDKMKDLGKAIGDFFIGAWNNIKSVWGSVKTFFSNIGNGIANTFKNVVDKIKGFFSGLWNSIKSGINGISSTAMNIANTLKSGVKGIINFFIDGINKFINGMNKIKWDVPDWVPVIGGKKWGINIPNVPRLAQGGIVDVPNKGVMMGSYVAGESGREGVLPLSNPTTMAELGQEIGKWVNLAIDNRMIVDGRVLATATNNQINKENFLMNR